MSTSVNILQDGSEAAKNNVMTERPNRIRAEEDDHHPKLKNEVESRFKGKVGRIMGDYKDGKRKSAFYDLNREIDKLNEQSKRITRGQDAQEQLVSPAPKYPPEYVSTFADQLRHDLEALDRGEEVSDCAYFAPRRPKGECLKKTLTTEIALTLYPPSAICGPHIDNVVKPYIWYQACLSRLTRQFKEQEFRKIVEREKFRIARLNEHRTLWCSLKNRPLSATVTEPRAMPVNISKEEELSPFFKFLKSNRVFDAAQAGSESGGGEWIEEDQCLKFFRGALYPDGRMDLCKQVVGPTWIEGLMKSVQHNEHLKHFLLGNNIIGSRGTSAIKDFLLSDHKPKVQTWYLAGNDINEEGMSHLADGLSYDEDVRELWLKRNPIKSEGMKHVARLLGNNQNITTLDLHNTAVLDDGMEYLCEGLRKNRGLRYIYLEANGITKAGVRHLVDYFKLLIEEKRVGITSLWISMNRLDDEGIIELVRSLKDYTFLERLCIGSNMMSSASLPHIYESFVNHPTLRLLDMGMYKSTADMGEITNRMGDEGAEWVAKLIRDNKTVEYISILHNDISNESITKIAAALESNSSVYFMDFKQHFAFIDQPVHVRIKERLEENRRNATIEDATSYARFLKHTQDIVNIDSVYRNSMK